MEDNDEFQNEKKKKKIRAKQCEKKKLSMQKLLDIKNVLQMEVVVYLKRKGKPGENDGVEAVEDPDGSDAATTRHGFSDAMRFELALLDNMMEMKKEGGADFESYAVKRFVFVKR